MAKRTLDSFFTPISKKQKPAIVQDEATEYTHHANYVFPIVELSSAWGREISSLPARVGKEMNDQPDLDLIYYEPFIPEYLAQELFLFLRSQLPFYRVEYKIKRGGVETQVRTPRYTTVFGLDSTAAFASSPPYQPIDATSLKPVHDRRYSRIPPRPIPQCLDLLRQSTEAATGHRFNFCLVNYYATGADSITFHSDDERFLGPEPAIASFSLGAKRDFLMKHKDASNLGSKTKQLKFALGNGDMLLMRGTTQSRWLHSVPKRTGKSAEEAGGRINITFRKAVVKDGTENYYNYNVGFGPAYRWIDEASEMKLWQPATGSTSDDRSGG